MKLLRYRWLAGSAAVAVSAIVAAMFAVEIAGAQSAAAVDRDQYLKSFRSLSLDLEELEEKIEDVPDKRIRKGLRETLADMRKDLAALQADLERAPVAILGNPGPLPPVQTPVIAQTAVVVAQTPLVALATPVAPPATPLPIDTNPIPTEVVPEAMTAAAFNDLMAALKKATYASDKIKVVKEVGVPNHLTVDQVILVMNVFTYSSEKISSAAMLYPNVVDKQNWSKAYVPLRYESDREKLRKLTTDK